ncbi:MAG: CCA tRNA nucleotidyltransferase [candidate division KSB1 bacterium]|nr:CCA tRNA nucleotidyltransferase [candidate division KSB1 bacterium]
MVRSLSKKALSGKIFSVISQIAGNLKVEAYVVGGFVRDRLLNLSLKRDIDFVIVGDGPAFAQAVAQALGAHKVSIYQNFGTASIRHRGFLYEFVGARSESYRGNSRKPQVAAADLPADLARRDFTINAMAVSLNRDSFGRLIDPFNGQSDLQARVIRTPLDPKQTFYDDPLRILRAIRFATVLDFNIEEQTFAALASEAHRLKIISQERITDELNKILLSAKPSVGFYLMKETGILDVILPEIAALSGVEQVGKHSHKDVFDHTMKVLDKVAAASPKLSLRYAALFHDVAKPATKAFDPAAGWTFHGHDELGRRMFKKIGERLRLPKDLIETVQKLIKLHLRPIHLAEEGVTDSAIRRLLFLAGDDIDDLMTLCRADITSANAERVKRHLANFDLVERRLVEVEEKDRLRNFQPPVRGDEIMQVLGLQPGPLVGKIKNAIEEAILNGVIPNEHDAAFDYMMQIKDDILSSASASLKPAKAAADSTER